MPMFKVMNFLGCFLFSSQNWFLLSLIFFFITNIDIICIYYSNRLNSSSLTNWSYCPSVVSYNICILRFQFEFNRSGFLLGIVTGPQKSSIRSKALNKPPRSEQTSNKDPSSRRAYRSSPETNTVRVLLFTGLFSAEGLVNPQRNCQERRRGRLKLKLDTAKGRVAWNLIIYAPQWPSRFIPSEVLSSERYSTSTLQELSSRCFMERTRRIPRALDASTPSFFSGF